MSPEQFTAILTALAAVLGAVAVCIAEVRRYRTAVTLKMDLLLALTGEAEFAKGKEAQRNGQDQPDASVGSLAQSDETAPPA